MGLTLLFDCVFLLCLSFNSACDRSCFAWVTGSFSGVFLFFACLPVKWKNGKLKRTHLLKSFSHCGGGCHAEVASVCLFGFRWDASLGHAEHSSFCFAKFSQLSLSWADQLDNDTLPLSIAIHTSPCHLLLTHVFLLLSGRTASTWSIYKGSTASSSSVKQRKQRGSGWSSLTWPCESTTNASLWIFDTRVTF